MHILLCERFSLGFCYAITPLSAVMTGEAQANLVALICTKSLRQRKKQTIIDEAKGLHNFPSVAEVIGSVSMKMKLNTVYLGWETRQTDLGRLIISRDRVQGLGQMTSQQSSCFVIVHCYDPMSGWTFKKKMFSVLQSCFLQPEWHNPMLPATPFCANPPDRLKPVSCRQRDKGRPHIVTVVEYCSGVCILKAGSVN